MIAYKLFEIVNGRLCPWLMSNRLEYDEDYIMQRPDGWGPFLCVKRIEDLSGVQYNWRTMNWLSAYKVKIKKSKDVLVWSESGGKESVFPAGTILADEFEILERVK